MWDEIKTAPTHTVQAKMGPCARWGLWLLFELLVCQRGLETVKITKVKGHAIAEMVEQGKVREEDKEGNDMADQVADQGATKSQGKLQMFAGLYVWRHSRYRKFMARLQRFIVKIKRKRTS